MTSIYSPSPGDRAAACRCDGIAVVMIRGAPGCGSPRTPLSLRPPHLSLTPAPQPPTILKVNINMSQSSAWSGSKRRLSSRVFCLIPAAILV